MKKVKLFEEFLNEATMWDKVRAKSKEMFGEWVLDALEEDEIAQLIDIPEADRIASKYFNEYTFMDLSLDQMGKLINKYPKVVKESLDEAMKEIDYSNSKNKIIAGLKTNIIYDMKDRYDYKEDGDKILFFDKKGHHFATLFDAGTRYQMIQHDGSLDDRGRLSESLDEATTSWSKMMASVRKSETGPWSLVAIKDKKVIAQKNDIRVQDMIPAHFEAMRKEYPNARIHIEDGTGMVVWNETK